MSVDNPSALKHMYNKYTIQRLAGALELSHSGFVKKDFLKLIPQLDQLEMKPRVLLIRNEMYRQLPQEFSKAVKILLTAAKKGKLQGFDLWPFTEYIQEYGIDESELSLAALEILTVPFTSEFAVRPFLIKYTKKTLSFLNQCALSKEVNVRRWASEGSRSRLPWGLRIHLFIKDPTLTLPILEKLKFDPELFVRKSVANHLNDIAKDHPDVVIKTLSQWQKEAKGENGQRVDWITKHALRTLIKAGDKEALRLIGVSGEAKVELSEFKINKKSFKLNDRLEVEFKIKSLSSKEQKLVIDYKIHYQKANQKSSGKVFKLKTLDLGPKESIDVRKSHHLKHVTTRVHYSGAHVIDILINGSIFKTIAWKLEV